MKTVRQLLLLDHRTVAILTELVERFTAVGIVEGTRPKPNPIQFGDEGVLTSRALNFSQIYHLLTTLRWPPLACGRTKSTPASSGTGALPRRLTNIPAITRPNVG